MPTHACPSIFKRRRTTTDTVAITDKIYVKNHRQLASQLETSFPKSAFSGATLDILFTGDGLAKLDDASRDRALDFAEDFLDCSCQSNPHCGCPQRKFIAYLLELRAEGLGPDAIVDVMGDDYMLYAYPGDILSFLDNGVRTLEAAEQLAEVDERKEMAEKIRRKKRELSG
ncbi:MAG: superfamily II helicase [Natronomonas sp.]|jgi:superfamily II helicase